MREAVRWAARHDLYVVLDMHQDSWGKFIATPPGTACPPGLGPAVGWDGAPEWATHTYGMTVCDRRFSGAGAQAALLREAAGASAPNARVAITLDHARFIDLLCDTLATY